MTDLLVTLHADGGLRGTLPALSLYDQRQAILLREGLERRRMEAVSLARLISTLAAQEAEVEACIRLIQAMVDNLTADMESRVGNIQELSAAVFSVFQSGGAGARSQRA